MPTRRTWKRVMLALGAIFIFGIALIAGAWNRACAGGSCPSIAVLSNYDPDQASRVYAADGRLITDRLGRTIIHGGAEAQYWRPLSRFQVAPAVFVDVVHLDRRAVPGTRDDVDVGAGMRLAGWGGGLLRLDVARGLRDGRMRVSAGFQP